MKGLDWSEQKCREDGGDVDSVRDEEEGSVRLTECST